MEVIQSPVKRLRWSSLNVAGLLGLGSLVFAITNCTNFSLEMLHIIVVTGFNLSEGFELTDFY